MSRLEHDTQQLAAALIERSRELAGRRSVEERLTEWALSSEAFKLQLFRFVDVFPRLRTPEAIQQHLAEYLQKPGLALPTGMRLALGAGAWLKSAMAATVTGQINAMASRFIAGEDFASALPKLREDWERGLECTIDLLGEAALSDAECAVYRDRYLQLIDAFADAAGAVPGRANVSLKLSAMTPKFDALDFDGSIERAVRAIAPILDRATARGVLINFDMESFATKDLTIATFMRACEVSDFPAGIAIQAYLRSGEDDAQRIIDFARKRSRPVTVRLVKGAYWDHEVIHAQERGWACPVWTDKSATDACFERMTDLLLAAHRDGVSLACASHNARSAAHAIATARAWSVGADGFELQMLYGMADGLKLAAMENGVRVRQYVPLGALAPGMAYLVRRLLENSSNESWLLKGEDRSAPIAPLIAAPIPKKESSIQRPSVDGFTNEPARDFASNAAREAFAHAVKGQALPPASERSPDAEALVQRACQAFPSWRDTDAEKRAQIILRAAQAMRENRDVLASIMVHEAQKPWRDADADVCEAIDFCAFYAMRAPALFEPKRLGNHIGEIDELWHAPRGVAVVISPWNFPLAICCGMTVAALVCGNCVIVKPAEQTPVIARRMCEFLWQAGVPREVLQFAAGPGETLGAALVRHPRVDLIAFTGSKVVGLDILRAASVVDETGGQQHVKHVVCEMGGKNAIVIDDTADLDEAVVGVRNSAFGYAGQKCSACSRVIVVESVLEEFTARLVEATRHLRVGDASDPATDVPPVIDDAAAQKVWAYIDLGKTEGQLLLGEDGVRSRAIPPHIFGSIHEAHRLFREEVFGPVLSITAARDFADAVRLALAVPYRLTGGVYSRTPSHIDEAKRSFRVGNLYINRGITGALVGRQPFGGIGLSGAGTKAGGDEYLLHFVHPRACTENVERRGFAPGTVGPPHA